MWLFDKIFRKKSSKPTDKDNFLFAYISSIKNKLDSMPFISKKEYLEIIEQHIEIKKEIEAVKKAGMLEEYCLKHGTSMKDAEEFLLFFENDEIRQKHNEAFLAKEKENNKEYFEHILDDCDPKIRLDEDQIKVVIDDEDNTLVVAGAGAGKTTTVAAKVKYLVDKKGIDPKEILVISFTNKAVDELKDRINKKLGIACRISTFHRVGMELINTSEDRKAVKEEGFLAASVRDYLKSKILTDKNMASKILLFFASYLKLPPDFDMSLNEFFDYVSKNEFYTMRGDLKAYADKVSSQRENKRRTIKNERVASYQELQIANFLFINGIDYKYEDPYKFHIKDSHKVYTPDFHIFQNGRDAYLEHFGMISDQGKNNSRNQDEIDRYIKAIKDKISLHKQHGTTLLKTFGGYSDGKDIVEHLRDELLNNGFQLHQRSEEEILSQIISSEQDKYIGKLIKLVKTFIEAYKTNGYTSGYFKILKSKTKNERDKLFLDICEGAYNNYENDLQINNAIDFSDMINDSVEIIREMQENNEKIPYKYIIVDEYQDISHQRYNLTKELSKICDAKIVAVGDDWQSIYAFSGSDITLFTEFKKNIKDPNLGCELLYINNTYRNAQELIDIAGKFVLKNTTQYIKTLKSPKNLADPVIIYSYCDDEKKIEEQELRNSMFQKANALEAILDRLVSEDPSILNRDKGKEPILLIGRFGFDAEKLSVGNMKEEFHFEDENKEDNQPYNIFDYYENGRRVVSKKYPTLRMAFMTAHSSKGLTYDNVIIINGMNDTNGFPSKKEDDPVLDLVIKRDKAIDYAEERRLFYVALTRTSNRVFIIAPETRPSEFVTELIKDKGYKNITVKGVFNETLKRKDVYYCPDCGFPLKYRGNSTLGLPLYICSNEHELCGFMSNDIKGGRLRICECSGCMNGYMIVKKRTDSNERFLGCTNYTKDGKGCNHTISMQDFDRLFPKQDIKHYTPEEIKNREALKYEGEEIERIDTSQSVEAARILREKETKKKECVETKTETDIVKTIDNELIGKIREKCDQYNALIYEKYSSKRNSFAYIKKGRSWYWFTIDLENLQFSFKQKRTDAFVSINIDESHLTTILETIDSLIRNYYKTPKSEPSVSASNVVKDGENPVLVTEPKPAKTTPSFFARANKEQTALAKEVIAWVKKDFKSITYINFYGIPQFRLNGQQKPLFWFSATQDDGVAFKYRETMDAKPNTVKLDALDKAKIEAIINRIVASNS